jgi:polysaccharide export outer membrane protein
MNGRKFLFRFCPGLLIIFLFAQYGFGLEKLALPEKRRAPVSDEKIYKIGSGDVLDIITWKEPDFSREDILVRIDGKISFPLLNDIQATGRTPVELKTEIENGLKKYVESPVVTVVIKNPASQKFYILGEVVRTGEYNLLKNLTILQAFALAGGFTEWASKDEIILFRNEGGRESIIRVDYKDIIKGEGFKQNIELRVNDTIIVP